MSTFSQWQRASCPAKRVTWVCGPEQALIDDVTDSVRSSCGDAGRVVLFAGSDLERDIWASCALIPPRGVTRLVAVHEAQRLRRLDELVPLVKAGREAAGVFLLFVSSEPDFTRVREEGRDVLAPHLAAIRDCRAGQLIRCVTPHDDDLLDWAARCWPGLTRNAAARLVERAAGELGAIREAGAKARATGLLDAKYIPVLCDPVPGGEFAELLLAGDRAGALVAARERPLALGAAVSLLDSRLRVLAVVREGQRSQLPAGQVASRFGVPGFLVTRYRDVAQQYGPARVRHCRELLAAADSAWRGGAESGVAEVLAANW